MKYNELPSKKIRDIRGEKFGRLTVLDFSHIAPDSGKNAYWHCVCDCGNQSTVHSGALRTGSTKSCGCLSSELSRDRIKGLHTKGDHLYFIRCGEYTKIGRADKPLLRLGQIKASNPYGVELIKVYENQGFMEKEIHAKYKEYHHTGEWFKLPAGFCEI